MTNEEAKTFLLQFNTDKRLNPSEHEAVRVAISALENRISIKQIRAEIENEADEYDAYVDADVAKGLYKAGEIIDKHMN